ncbi:MAG: NUDIX hydrolase [Candidatus Kryptoniota bacterium]
MAKVDISIVEVVVFRRRPEVEFLVLKRSDHEDIYPGIWQIISGGIERRERAYETALREIREEIGMVPVHLYNTPLTNVFYSYQKDKVNLSAVFAAEVSRNSKIMLSNEHSSYRWLPEIKAKKQLVWPGQKEAISTVYEYILKNRRTSKLLELPIKLGL